MNKSVTVPTYGNSGYIEVDFYNIPPEGYRLIGAIGFFASCGYAHLYGSHPLTNNTNGWSFNLYNNTNNTGSCGVTGYFLCVKKLTDEIFPDIKYLIQSGVLMFDTWSWSNASGATGRAYQSGTIYCLESYVTTIHGQGINFRMPVIKTDKLSKLQIDFDGITNPDYSVTVKILNQNAETLLNDNVTVNEITQRVYDISNYANIIIQITVSMANGTNTLRISNIMLY